MKKGRLVALLTPKNVSQCITAYEACRKHDVVLEIAFRTEVAEEGIKAVIRKYPDALLLAGTVMTEKQARAAIRSGGAGIVSADYIPGVVDVCIRQDVLCVPGGLSDAGKQLVQKASGYGCSLEDLKSKHPNQWIYKLFPAFSEGKSRMELAKAWRGPYPGLQMLYAGGINRNTLGQAFQMDPEGIFCGSALAKNVNEPEKMENEIAAWERILTSAPVLSDRVPAKKPLSAKPAQSFRKPRIVTFGEMMIRLSPPHGVQLRHTQAFDVHFGGAEANAAVSLAHFGAEALFVSAVPDNDIGANALGHLSSHGVDTRFILRKGSRMGIYYLEHGSGQRPSKVVYDRAGSAASRMTPGDFDWPAILEGANWFHWSGITPALGDSVVDCLREGLETAKQKGIMISVDLNYRRKLWTKEKARSVMTELMSYVDVCIGNEEDPITVFGMTPGDTDVSSGRLSAEGYKDLAVQIHERFELSKVAITLRESLSASENKWSACLYDGKNFYHSPKYHIWIVDRVGTGDAFAAGLIYGFLAGWSSRKALDFGTAAACLKHSIRGDFNTVSRGDVERLASGDQSGRVLR